MLLCIIPNNWSRIAQDRRGVSYHRPDQCGKPRALGQIHSLVYRIHKSEIFKSFLGSIKRSSNIISFLTADWWKKLLPSWIQTQLFTQFEDIWDSKTLLQTGKVKCSKILRFRFETWGPRAQCLGGIKKQGNWKKYITCIWKILFWMSRELNRVNKPHN